MHIDGVIFLSNIGSAVFGICFLSAVKVGIILLSNCSHTRIRIMFQNIMKKKIINLFEVFLSIYLDVCILCAIQIRYLKLDEFY